MRVFKAFCSRFHSPSVTSLKDLSSISSIFLRIEKGTEVATCHVLQWGDTLWKS
jgi:hypothetical protein